MLRLFRHVPSAKWLGLIQSADDVTPGTAYLAELAARYRVPEGELEVIESSETLPADFETNALPVPVDPPTLEQLEEGAARTLRLPDFAQIEAVVAAAVGAAQGGNWTPLTTLLSRLAKLTRVLTTRTL